MALADGEALAAHLHGKPSRAVGPSTGKSASLTESGAQNYLVNGDSFTLLLLSFLIHFVCPSLLNTSFLILLARFRLKLPSRS